MNFIYGLLYAKVYLIRYILYNKVSVDELSLIEKFSYINFTVPTKLTNFLTKLIFCIRKQIVFLYIWY